MVKSKTIKLYHTKQTRLPLCFCSAICSNIALLPISSVLHNKAMMALSLSLKEGHAKEHVFQSGITVFSFLSRSRRSALKSAVCRATSFRIIIIEQLTRTSQTPHCKSGSGSACLQTVVHSLVGGTSLHWQSSACVPSGGASVPNLRMSSDPERPCCLP